ncbi:unnamed protein product, partial [Tilletia caries]
LAIQEKSISSWSFDPDYEDNPSVFFVGRTELTYLADGQGMAAEGGGTCMLSNLPLSKPSRTKKCQGPNDIHQGANNYVGINFDDDPTQSIPRLKQFLLKNHISATRFLTGGQVAGMTSAFKDIIKDPSPQLAVHTYTHQQMTINALAGPKAPGVLMLEHELSDTAVGFFEEHTWTGIQKKGWKHANVAEMLGLPWYTNAVLFKGPKTTPTSVLKVVGINATDAVADKNGTAATGGASGTAASGAAAGSKHAGSTAGASTASTTGVKKLSASSMVATSGAAGLAIVALAAAICAMLI